MSRATAIDFAVNIDNQSEEQWSTVQRWMDGHTVGPRDPMDYCGKQGTDAAEPGEGEPVGEGSGECKPVSAADEFVTHTWQRIDEEPRQGFLANTGKVPKWDPVIHRDT